jgi:hypothetical protein
MAAEVAEAEAEAEAEAVSNNSEQMVTAVKRW